MTAATVTPEVMYARAVLRTILPYLQPVPSARRAIAAAGRLDRALDDYRLIVTGETSWECFYPWLADEADPHEAALAKAAEEAGECAEALITAMARCSIRVPDEAKGEV